MSYLDICRKQLPIDEARRPHMYQDSLGIWTAGIGRNLNNAFSDDEIDLMFENDLRRAVNDALAVCPSFEFLTDARKAVLVNMSFNMNKARLLGFAKMLDAIAQAQFDRAADEMKNSKWYVQVGERGKRLEQQMRKG